jgi:hypothetical protein
VPRITLPFRPNWCASEGSHGRNRSATHLGGEKAARARVSLARATGGRLPTRNCYPKPIRCMHCSCGGPTNSKVALLARLTRRSWRRSLMPSTHTKRSAGLSAKSLAARASASECNLYSLNKKRDAVARFFRVSHNRGAAFEPLSAIFPGHVASVIRQSSDGDREIVLMSWGFVLLQKDRAPRRVTRRAKRNSTGGSTVRRTLHLPWLGNTRRTKCALSKRASKSRIYLPLQREPRTTHRLGLGLVSKPYRPYAWPELTLTEVSSCTLAFSFRERSWSPSGRTREGALYLPASAGLIWTRMFEDRRLEA